MSRRHTRSSRRIPPKTPSATSTTSISVGSAASVFAPLPTLAVVSVEGQGTCPAWDVHTAVVPLDGAARILADPVASAPVAALAALLSRSSPLVAAQRPALIFRHVVPGVTRVPEDCRVGDGVIIIHKLLRWFCPALTEAEALRLAARPEAPTVQLLPRPIKAFIERWAYS